MPKPRVGEIWEVNYRQSRDSRNYFGDSKWDYFGNVKVLGELNLQVYGSYLCEVLTKDPNHATRTHPSGPWKLYVTKNSFIKKI